MPRKCCVVNCNTNYRNGKVGAVYRFPKNPCDKQKWIQNLPNRNFVWTASKVVCEYHWPKECARKKVQGGHKVPDEPPTIFSDVPKSCVPTPAPKRRKLRTLEERNARPDELPAFLDRDRLNYENCTEIINQQYTDVVCIKIGTELNIVSTERDGAIRRYTVFLNLQTKEYACYWKFIKVIVPCVRSNKLDTYSELEAVIAYLKVYESDSARANFCNRQIELLERF